MLYGVPFMKPNFPIPGRFLANAELIDGAAGQAFASAIAEPWHSELMVGDHVLLWDGKHKLSWATIVWPQDSDYQTFLQERDDLMFTMCYSTQEPAGQRIITYRSTAVVQLTDEIFDIFKDKMFVLDPLDDLSMFTEHLMDQHSKGRALGMFMEFFTASMFEAMLFSGMEKN